ncbi:unnamed protein product [Allacma fusca]|uniref:DUF4817 domain-containing protein n=1 Tax=Allacma fusca TaxID=39272 RepID=A0A8J2J7G2_9HEXA|nr:unnamed protein product [Allacma fusca]
MPLNQKNQYENTYRGWIIQFYLHAEGEPRIHGRAKSIQQIVEVQERYRQVFNTRSVPCRKTALRHIRHFRHDASLANHKSTGRPRTVRNNANVELIREILEERPGSPFNGLGQKPESKFVVLANLERPRIDQRPCIDRTPCIDKRPDIVKKPSIAKRPDIVKRGRIDKRPDSDKRPFIDKRPDIVQRPPIDQTPCIDKPNCIVIRPCMDITI